MFSKPIPQNCAPITTNTAVCDCNEPLISIIDVNEPRIMCKAAYYEQGIPGAIHQCCLRESVFRLLQKALLLLPENLGFMIFDAWRPYAVQKYLFDIYYKSLAIKEENKTLPDEELKRMARLFVSEPSTDPSRPHAHSTGGAVDLTLARTDGGELLDMGGAFDEFSEQAYTDYYEYREPAAIRMNRRMLYYTMIQVGFTNLPSEWWHYDYGDGFWAFYKQKNAFYGSIEAV